MGLTKDQQAAFDACMSGKNVFITGGGGVGKTYLINRIADALHNAGRTVMLTAYTGLAARLIGGSTCHSAFGIPRGMAWKESPTDYEHLVATDTVIIDEVSMLRMDQFDFVLRCLKKADAVREENGMPPIQLIVIGDFLQLPPVLNDKKDGSPSDAELLTEHYGFDVGGAFAFQFPGWDQCHFSVINLLEVVRQSDKEEAAILSRLRFGDPTALPAIQNMSRKNPFSPEEKGVYYLCGKNKTADRINRSALEKLPGPEKEYRSIVEGCVAERDKPCPDRIRLRVGARVMMLVNAGSYVNGSLGTITGLYDDYVSIRIDDSPADVTVVYNTWDVTTYKVVKNAGSKKRDVRQVVIGRYSHLPLRLAYAITIHKSQGQTLEKAVLNIGKNGSEIFADGQFYVGASRVKNLKNLYIDGDLSKVRHLASRAVLDYYSSVGITFDPAQHSPRKVTDPEKAPEGKRNKKGRRTRPRKGTDAPIVIEKNRDPEPKKQAEKAGEKRVRIAVTALQRPVIMAFARVLDPGAYTDGSSVAVTEGWADTVKDFLAKL